jgi:hypothetical protein
MPIVERTLDNLIERLDGNMHPEAILHSDQWMHYTNPGFQDKVKTVGFKQSMSRKGNCWGNASMESFFGHMKYELEYKDSVTFEELRSCVDNYISYYNTSRYQWTLKKMTPDVYCIQEPSFDSLSLRFFFNSPQKGNSSAVQIYSYLFRKYLYLKSDMERERGVLRFQTEQR